MIGETLEHTANAYATVIDVNHKIEWWAIIMCSMIIIAVLRFLRTSIFLGMIPGLQMTVALFLKFVMLFCLLLILIQFEPYWMPHIENLFNWVGGWF